MQVVLVHNPRSGTALAVTELDKHFADAGITLVDHVAIGPNLDKDLQPYLDQTKTVVAVYGGDGTQSAVANLATNKPVVIAPLAGGTLNHFVKDLGIPTHLPEALASLRNAKPRKIDVAQVNDNIVINNSSIGLYPSALQMRDEMTRKSIAKWPAAIIASVKASWRYKSYEISIKGETFRSPFVFVGNNDYAIEDSIIGDRDRVDQGILSVYAVESSGRRKLLWIIILAIFGKLQSANEVKIWKTDAVTIRAKTSHIRVSRDGEHETMDTPLEYRIVKGALNIIGNS